MRYFLLLLALACTAHAELPTGITDPKTLQVLEYLDAKINKAQKSVNTLSGSTQSTSTVVAISNGGTSATTAAGARANLGVPSDIGTGATGTWPINITGSAATATDNSKVAKTGDTMTGNLLVGASVQANIFQGDGSLLIGVVKSLSGVRYSTDPVSTALVDLSTITTSLSEKVPYTGATTDLNLGTKNLVVNGINAGAIQGTSINGTHYGDGTHLTGIASLADSNYWTGVNQFHTQTTFDEKIFVPEIQLSSSIPSIMAYDGTSIKNVLMYPGIEINSSPGYAYNWVLTSTDSIKAKYYDGAIGQYYKFDKYGLVVSSGIRAGASRVDGSGGVNIIGSDGRIPAITSTYFANLDGSAITGLSTNDTTKVLKGGDTMSGSLIFSPTSISTGNIIFQGLYPHSIQHNNNSLTASQEFLGEYQMLQGGTGKHRIIAYGDAHATYPKEMQIGSDATSLGTNVRITGNSAMNPDLFVSSWTSVGINKSNPYNGYKLDVNGYVNSTGYYLNGSPFTAGGDVLLASTQTFTAPNTFTNSVTASTLTVTGSSFSVGGSTLAVEYGSVLFGTNTITETGTNRQPIEVYSPNSNGVRVTYQGNAGAGYFARNLIAPSAADQRLGFVIFGSTGTYGQLNATLVGGYSGEAWSNTAKGSYLRFETTANGGVSRTEKMRITPSGSVGILTTTPDQALTVAGNISATGVVIASGTGSNYFAGNMGIGTSNPSSKLDVSGGDYTTIWARSNTTHGGQLNLVSTLAKWSTYVEGEDLRFYESGDKVTFQKGGRVGIGTTAPGSKLEVNGTVTATAFSGDGSALTGISPGSVLSSTNTWTGANTHQSSTTFQGGIFGNTNFASTTSTTTFNGWVNIGLTKVTTSCTSTNPCIASCPSGMVVMFTKCFTATTSAALNFISGSGSGSGQDVNGSCGWTSTPANSSITILCARVKLN